MPCLSRLLPMLLLALPAASAWAQQQEDFRQVENVRIDYAHVLRAEPVYETLRATSMVERCEEDQAPHRAEEAPQPAQRGGLSRVIDAVKGALGAEPKVEEVAPSAGGKCRMVPVEREFRRPVAWDVDYVHKGVKYRSRLPYDPGNRLRVRVSVTPVIAPEER